MSYTIRNTSPVGQYLPYYMKSPTGINNAILGNTPQGENIGMTGADVLFNCVGYSVGRCCEMWNEQQGTIANPTNPFNIFAPYNAEEWYNVAVNNGYNVGAVPQNGAVGVYTDGSIGHVCNVEYYDSSSGLWMISESHYWYDYQQGRVDHGSWDFSFLNPLNLKPEFIANDSSWQLIGFIYPFGTVPPTPTEPTVLVGRVRSRRHRRRR